MKKEEMYLKINYFYVDSKIMAALGIIPCTVFNTLRRYIWRSESSGTKETISLMKKGFIVARIAQGTLSRDIGVSRKTVNIALKKLKEIGWIKQHPTNNKTLVYILGKTNSQGEEILFYDNFMSGLKDYFEQCVTGLAAYHDENPDALDDLTLDGQDLVTLTKHFVEEKRRLNSKVSQTPVTLSYKGCNPGLQGLSPTVTGVVTQGYTEVDKRRRREVEVENDIELTGATHRHSKGTSVTNRFSKFKEKLNKNHDKKDFSFLEPKNKKVVSSKLKEQSIKDPKKIANVKKSSAESKGTFPPKDSIAGRRQHLLDLGKQSAEKTKKANTEKEVRRNLNKQRAENLQSKGNPKKKTSVKPIADLWRSQLALQFPKLVFADWGPAEINQAHKVLEKYNYDLSIVLGAVQYLFSCWEAISQRMFKRKTGIPTIGFLLKMHGTIVPESQRFMELLKIKQEWDAWEKENGQNDLPPDDLWARYKEVKPELKELGIID